jgi:hypothetical protein
MRRINTLSSDYKKKKKTLLKCLSPYFVHIIGLLFKRKQLLLFFQTFPIPYHLLEQLSFPDFRSISLSDSLNNNFFVYWKAIPLQKSKFPNFQITLYLVLCGQIVIVVPNALCDKILC